MPELNLSRRAALTLPFLLAACGGTEPATFEPLRYDYLPPIQLNVGAVDVEQRFVPSGVAPDVSPQAPVKPVEVLKTMLEERLRPFGSTGRAVAATQEASLTRERDTISGAMAVVVTITNLEGAQLGFAEARVSQRSSGGSGSLRSRLYEMVKSMMDDMNVELEYQIRRNLRPWLVDAAAVPTPVEQTPLEGSPLERSPMEAPPRERPPAL